MIKMPDWREESFVLPPGFREQSCDDGDGRVEAGSRASVSPPMQRISPQSRNHGKLE